MLWYILTAALPVWVIAISVWIIFQRRTPNATLAWIFGLALMPGVGILVYVLFGPRRLKRKHMRRAMAKEAVTRWTDGKGITETDLGRVEGHRQLAIVRVGARSAISSVVTRNRARIFFDGDECFESILEAIGAAEHHVHLECYNLSPHRWGTRLSEALQKKAREGIEVRLLVDGFGSRQLTRRFRKPLLEAGVELSFFNSMRFSRFKPGLANFRLHRKIVVVDGRTAFTGGMNIADEHSPSISGCRAWRDSHLRLDGAASIPLQLIFLEDWHYATGLAPENAALLPRPAMPTKGTLTQIVSSGPDDDYFGIHRVLFTAIGQAQQRVLATTPYFVPDESILAALTNAALKGVDVRLLVPRRSDSLLVGAAARSYYAEILQAGVRVFEYQPSMIHAKTMVIDDDTAIIGTANLDNRSLRLNFEVIAVLYDEAHAKTLAERFALDLESAEEITESMASESAISHRLVRNTARLLSSIL
jgi:cardiolipin synthase A/B